LALGLASLLGHWILYVLSPVFAAFFLATLLWAAGMLSLASAVLVLTEATGLNAVGIALRRARNHALSLTLLTGLMALATLVLVTVALGIFAATHPDLVSSFAKLWRIPAAASTRAEWFSAFSRISDSRSLSALQTVLVPVFSAYTSTAFIVWFAGTEAAPTAPVAPPSLTPSDTPASRPFTAPLPGVDHV